MQQLALFRNKKLTGKHCFLPFIAKNNVTYSANNDPNQLHTKVETRKQLQYILKHITIIYITNKKMQTKCKQKQKWNDSNYILKEGCLLQTSTLSLYIY
jgi:hypothetical protein